MSDSVLALAVENLAAATRMPSAVRLSSWWVNYADQARDRSARFGSAIEAIHFGQMHGGFDGRVAANPEECMKSFKSLEAEFPHCSAQLRGAEESEYSVPETITRIFGLRVSNVHFWHLRQVLATLDFEAQTIVEIGGGYGATARLRYMLDRPEAYYLVDLPESLFFAECFLRLHFEEVTYVRKPDDFTNGINLVPVALANDIPAPVSLVSNASSMGEMTPEAIKFYAELLDRLEARYFYSLNRFGNPLDEQCETANLMRPWPGKAWGLIQSKYGVHVQYGLGGPALMGPRTLAELIYQRGASTQQALKTLPETIDGQTLVLLCEHFRHNPGPEIVHHIQKRSSRYPQELLFMIDQLNDPSLSDVRAEIVKSAERLVMKDGAWIRVPGATA